MKYDPKHHHRRSIRLPGYDYTQPGAYFVTLVAHQRECLFGEVVDGEMWLNEMGRIARDEWFRSAEIRREIQLNLDEFVAMPNHIHGIVWIVGAIGQSPMVGAHGVGAHGRAPLLPRQRPPRSLASFIAGFKSVVTKRVNQHRGMPGVPL